MPVNPLKLLKAARPAAAVDKERRALQGLYHGYAGDGIDAKTLEEIFATPQRAVAEQLAQKRAAQTGLSPRVEMLMADPNAGIKHELITRRGTKTQARRLKPEDIVSRSELEYRPDLPTMYHGGTYRRGDTVNSPLYLTDDPEFAQSYVDFKDKAGSRVLALKPEIYRTAPEKRFNELAKRYVPENDEYGYTPASALDPTMHDKNRVADLINALWDDEWDSAKAFDLGMGGNGAREGVVTIMLPGTKAYAKGGAVKADNKSEIERLLAKYPNPRDVRYAPQVEGRGSELREQFPGTYGALGGLLGTAPDEFERGSVLSESDSARDAAVKAGAEYGYPVGMALNVAPLLSGVGGLAAKYGPAAVKNASVPSTLSKQAGVIKAPGGNWLSGSVEDSLKGLKRPDQVRQGNNDITLEQALNWPGLAPQASKDLALNSWIDKQLTRYVKNDMATERDPVRALAERGVLHYAPDEAPMPRSGRFAQLASERKAQGFPEEGLAQSDLAKRYEVSADELVRTGTAEMYQSPEYGYSSQLKKDPWLAKVAPETPVYTAHSRTSGNLGFNHLIDELRNATNPNSGLPADLLLKYDALDKVSVPQAVERVAKINEWRAAQKAEADMARANNAATVLHKEYPEQGMKWVELRTPEVDANDLSDLPEWQRKMIETNRAQGIDDNKGVIQAKRDANMVALRDALKYEGDTMGHCVGGYCDDVASGASRIYSLRDAKGRPHVTVEVKPARSPIGNPEKYVKFSQLSPEQMSSFDEYSKSMGNDPLQLRRLEESHLFNPESGTIVRASEVNPPPSVVQIKGKGNKKPNDEYLPFVQDFVKSGKWSDVGDLQNTDLVNFKGGSTRYRAAPGGNPLEFTMPSGYLTPSEAAEHLIKQGADESWARKHVGDLKGLGFAKGGMVKAKPTHPCACSTGYAEGGFVQFDPSRVDQIVEQLRAEFA